MNGLGFLVWQIKHIYPVEDAIAEWQNRGVQWVSIKFLNGTTPYNLIDANGKPTRDDSYVRWMIQQIQAAGIEVGTWHFIFTDNAKNQGRAVSDVINKFGLSHLLIDAEQATVVGALWASLPMATTSAAAWNYMEGLSSLPSGFPVALCSYRFPTVWPTFPFSSFVKHPKHKHVSSQMYWVRATTPPSAQLQRSILEYNKIKAQPHIPIGSAYREHNWETTAAELQDFIYGAKSQGCPGWGFWSWDQAKFRPEWLNAIEEASSGSIPPPPPPPPPGGDEVLYSAYVNSMSGLNVREGPSTNNRIIATLTYKAQVAVYEEYAGWARISPTEDAWVYAYYLTKIDAPPPPPPPAEVLYKAVVNASAGLNVRSGPGTSYAKIRALPFGTQVSVYKEDGDWAKISPDKEEWVSSVYLTKI